MDQPSAEIMAARAKLREQFGNQSAQLGGKGTARRKPKKVHKGAHQDDKKLQATFKKVGCNQFAGIDCVIFLREDESALMFMKPRLLIAPAADTYVVQGTPIEKSSKSEIMSEFMNDSLPPDIAESCKKLGIDPKNISAESLAKAFSKIAPTKTDENDGIPDLVENFEEVSKEES